MRASIFARVGDPQGSSGGSFFSRPLSCSAATVDFWTGLPLGSTESILREISFPLDKKMIAKYPLSRPPRELAASTSNLNSAPGLTSKLLEFMLSHWLDVAVTCRPSAEASPASSLIAAVPQSVHP